MTLACTPGTRASTRREWRRERPTGDYSYRVVEATAGAPPPSRPGHRTEEVKTALQAERRPSGPGFLLKDTAPEELLAAIRVLAAGDALLAPSITRRLIREFAERPEPGTHSSAKLLDPLSIREREVLIEMAGGWSNSEISERLHISAATAKTHVSRLLMKLDVHDRAQRQRVIDVPCDRMGSARVRRAQPLGSD